ncbi:MAG TPA: hypothetical protein VII11_11130, partial [Bacteroidota bacterium]
AVRYDAAADYFWLSRFRRRDGLLLAAAAFAVCAGVLTFQPTFSNLWKQQINVEQTVKTDSSQVVLTLTSNEYLNGTTVNINGRDTAISERTSRVKLGEVPLSGEPWISVERTVETTPSDTATKVDMTLTIHTRTRPFTLTVTYSSPRHELLTPQSPLAFSSTERTMTFLWYSFPDTVLTLPVQLAIAQGDSLLETVEAIFMEQYVPVNAQKDHASVTFRTVVRQSTHLSTTPR